MSYDCIELGVGCTAFMEACSFPVKWGAGDFLGVLEGVARLSSARDLALTHLPWALALEVLSETIYST